jgi:hypothetical protein
MNRPQIQDLPVQSIQLEVIQVARDKDWKKTLPGDDCDGKLFLVWSTDRGVLPAYTHPNSDDFIGFAVSKWDAKRLRFVIFDSLEEGLFRTEPLYFDPSECESLDADLYYAPIPGTI